MGLFITNVRMELHMRTFHAVFTLFQFLVALHPRTIANFIKMKTKVIRMRNASLKIAHQLDNLLRRSFQLYSAVQLLQNMHTTNVMSSPF